MGLSIQNLSLSIGKRELFRDESVGIADGSKVGLIGRNGVGKTTLLKAILGQADYSGEIEYKGKAAYFSQAIELNLNKTVEETLRQIPIVHHHNPLENQLQFLEKQLSNPEIHSNQTELTAVMDRYLELQAKIAKQQIPLSASKIKSVLATLGIEETWLTQTVSSLSTGQRAIVALAQVLSSDADLLLLDEPTNHLDFRRLEILENYLRQFKGTVLMVTHDRYFLDRVCDTILKIENGKWVKYNSNYSGYVKSRMAAYDAQKTAFELETKYIADEKDKIARIGKSPQKVKQGHYREKLLEKRAAIERPDLDQSNFKTHFEATPINANTILELSDLSVGYDKPLLSHINLNMGIHQRIILVGENGIGKSTLFKTIEGRLPALSGKVVLDSKAKIGYADQEMRDLTGSSTLYDEINAHFDDMAQTRRHLSMVGFISDDEVYKPISQLSMGEKSRLNLLKILIEKPNLLLLDEPTNHLDIDAREIIENAFLNYDGAILAVSHDRYFIQKIAQRLLKATHGTIQETSLKK